MHTPEPLESAFARARDQYAELGVDVNQALTSLRSIALSLHCWQGDDVHGFERKPEAASSGGIQVTGAYPGAARSIEELRADLQKAYTLIPGSHRLNLHAMYGDFGSRVVDRDQIEPSHFLGWMDWCREHHLGLDFNATCFGHPRADTGFTLSSTDAGIRNFWIEHVRRCREIGAVIAAAGLLAAAWWTAGTSLGSWLAGACAVAALTLLAAGLVVALGAERAVGLEPGEVAPRVVERVGHRLEFALRAVEDRPGGRDARPEQRAAFERLQELTPDGSVVGASLNAGAVMMYTGRDAIRPYDSWTDDQWAIFLAAMREERTPRGLVAHLVAGGFDYLLKTRVADMAAYREFVGTVIWTLPGVRETRTYAVMEEVKNTTTLAI